MKNTSNAYTNTNQSTLGKICDYTLTAIGNAGRMGYITRSLLIGGVVTVLIVSCLNPLGFLTGPIAIAVAVGVSALLFGAATVTDRYFQAQRDREELDNLRLRLFEVKEKEQLKDHLIKQRNILEKQNNDLEAQIALKKQQLDDEDKKAAAARATNNNSSTNFATLLSNFFFKNKAEPVAACRAQSREEHQSLLDSPLTPVY